MKQSKAEAKFFCENCGTEVSGKARICPVCGKFFASVKCPKCGRIGLSEEFKNGCPDCGYSMSSTREECSSTDEEGDVLVAEKHSKLALKKNKAYQAYESYLPVWVYIITLIVLVVLLVCFWSCL